MSKEYDNTNTGAMFNAEHMKVIRQGPLDVEGNERSFCICQTQTKTGKVVFEVYEKVGAIFTNDRKRTDKDPDMSGTVTLDGVDYMMFGRKRQSKAGVPFTGVNITVKEELPGPGAAANEPAPADGDDFNDDIPF